MAVSAVLPEDEFSFVGRATCSPAAVMGNMTRDSAGEMSARSTVLEDPEASATGGAMPAEVDVDACTGVFISEPRKYESQRLVVTHYFNNSALSRLTISGDRLRSGVR